MILGNYEKQPGEVERYIIDYADALDKGDHVLKSSATVSPEGLDIVRAETIENRVRVTLSGGMNTIRYKITVVAETADGRVLEDEFYLKVKDI